MSALNIDLTDSYFRLCILSFSVSKAKFDAADTYQASSRYHPYTESQEPENPVIDASVMNPYFPVPYSNTEGGQYFFLQIICISFTPFRGKVDLI